RKFPARRLARGARALERALCVLLAGAQLEQPLLRGGECAGELFAAHARGVLGAGQVRELVAGLLHAERLLLGGRALRRRGETPQLILQLLDAGALALARLLGRAHLLGVRLPALLPLLQRALGALERLGGVPLGLLGGGELRGERADLCAQRRELRLIAGDVARELRERALGLRQVGALAFAQLARVLDRLLQTRD